VAENTITRKDEKKGPAEPDPFSASRQWSALLVALLIDVLLAGLARLLAGLLA
jgi:hypothetical protein